MPGRRARIVPRLCQLFFAIFRVAASPASLRIADMRMMIDDEPRRRSSSDTLHAFTVALVKPGRGACWNQTWNSFSAML
jgi:hypothetical protein